MDNNLAGFTRITSDKIINEGRTLLYGFHIQASTDGGDISIYEGIDAQSGRLLGTFKGLANDPKIVIYSNPLFMDRGLFVDVGSNVTAVTIYWLPV